MKKLGLTILVLIGFVAAFWGTMCLIMNKTQIGENEIRIVRVDHPFARIEYIWNLRWNNERIFRRSIVPGPFIRINYDGVLRRIDLYQRGYDFYFFRDVVSFFTRDLSGNFTIVEGTDWWGASFQTYKLPSHKFYRNEYYRTKLEEAKRILKETRERFKPLIEKKLKK